MAVAKGDSEKLVKLRDNLSVVERNVEPLRHLKCARITGITETVRLVSGHRGVTVIKHVQLGTK